jgi:hypothetical protein
MTRRWKLGQELKSTSASRRNVYAPPLANCIKIHLIPDCRIMSILRGHKVSNVKHVTNRNKKKANTELISGSILCLLHLISFFQQGVTLTISHQTSPIKLLQSNIITTSYHHGYQQ